MGLTPDWEPCVVGMAEHKRVVELLRIAEERLAAWERDIDHMEHEKNQQIADLTVRAEGAEAALEDISVRARERSEMIKELQGEQRYASQRIAALTAENERLKTEYNRKDADIARLRERAEKAEARAKVAEDSAVKVYIDSMEQQRVALTEERDLLGKRLYELNNVYGDLRRKYEALSAPGADGGKAPRV